MFHRQVESTHYAFIYLHQQYLTEMNLNGKNYTATKKFVITFHFR